ncbi:MAG TPA: hypothetical protein VKB23_02915 [Solirubrobacterales bacterium]|jgi:hypothetical protein|nr:hypothetical protein [Solirubrobacterales bacterium]
MTAFDWYLGPEDEPEDSEDAYEPLDTIDLTEADLGPEVEADE